MKSYVGLTLFLLAFQVQANQLNQLLSDKLYLHVKMEPSQKIIETEPLRKFYEQNNFNTYWTQNGRANNAAQVLRQVLSQSDDWGLISSQYMSRELTTLFDTVTDKNAITLELLLSEAYLKFAQDIMNGQILDPDLIDEDIKMPRKAFDVIPKLAQGALRAETIVSTLDSLTPQHEKYKALIGALRKLNTIKARNTWAAQLVDPKIDFKLNAKHSVFVEVKKRLNDLGYPVNNETNVYDAELQRAAMKFQELNGYVASRTLSRTFFRAIAPGIQERIDRIKANLEKFRWFPQVWENNYLMVNLAFQEMRVVESGKTVISMKTVNGRPTRRTPTMRDEIRRVELSPTWTVPFSIAVKDKLPDLQENPNAMNKSGIKFYDRNGNDVNPAYVNWRNVDRRNFDYTLVQQPGPNNALGLVKFPLTNPWFIYLHDTNDHPLMKKFDRLLSSGCVRLEDAFKLAQYLLRDQPDWTLAQMKTPRSAPLPVPVKQRLPVYLIYQTVDVTAEGEIRMAIDHYGQDQRLTELFKSRGSREKF